MPRYDLVHDVHGNLHLDVNTVRVPVIALHLRVVHLDNQRQPHLRHDELVDCAEPRLRIKVILEILQEPGAVRLLHVHQILEHAGKFLDILLLLLHIQIVAGKLRELLCLLGCQVQALCERDLLLHCLVAVGEERHLLVDGSVHVLRALLDHSVVARILLQFRDFRDVTADPGDRASSENLPRLGERLDRIVLAVGRRHDDGAHVNVCDLFLVPVQPAGVEELLHISADAVPLHRRRENDAVRVLQGLRQRDDIALKLVQIIALHIDIEFAQHLLYLI